MSGAIGIDFKTSASPSKHPPPSALLSYPSPMLLFQPVNHLLYLQLTCKTKPQHGLSPLARRKGSSPGGAGSCLPMQWSVRGWGWPSPGSALQALSSGAPTHGTHWPKCTGLCQHAGYSDAQAFFRVQLPPDRSCPCSGQGRSGFEGAALGGSTLHAGTLHTQKGWQQGRTRGAGADWERFPARGRYHIPFAVVLVL